MGEDTFNNQMAIAIQLGYETTNMGDEIGVWVPKKHVLIFSLA